MFMYKKIIQYKKKRKEKIIDLAEWIIWQNIAIIYPRLYEYTKQIKKKNFCPFCYNDYIVEESFVHLRKNIYPYYKTQDHLLLCTNRHISTYSELTPEEEKEIFMFLKEYLNKWYIMLWRQYPHSGASVPHFHIHLIKQKTFIKKSIRNILHKT